MGGLNIASNTLLYATAIGANWGQMVHIVSDGSKQI